MLPFHSKSKVPFKKVLIITQFTIKFDNNDNTTSITRWKKGVASRKRVDEDQERVTCTRVSGFYEMTILRYMMTVFCSADSVIQRDLFQLKSTQIVVLYNVHVD